MSPLDGLKRVPEKDKIYRSKNRVNFLVDPLKEKEFEQTNESAENKNPVRKDLSRISKPKVPKYNFLKIILIILLIILISGAMYFSEKLFSPSKDTLASLNRFNPFSKLAKLITSADKRVDGEDKDRINILALGIGGDGHDGPLLTDTIIIISIKPSTGEVGLVSIPRDTFIHLRDGEWYKINEVYSMGKVQKRDQGSEYIIQAIEDTFDIPIHYFGIITFEGFKKFIDEIEGITIDVPTSFTDNLYPTNDYKTTTVSFTKGLQIMNGEKALIYARSRHGDNFEGSDFARSKRQQLILQSIKDKMFRFSTLLNPNKLSATFDLLGNSVETNMSIWQAIKIIQMVKNTDESKIYRIILDDMPDSLLEPGFSEQGAWILKPKDGNFETLARQFNNIFNTGVIKKESAKIEIQNGTETNGLAYWTAYYLEKLGYTISNYKNADSQDYQRTVIYDLSDGQKKETLQWLKEELHAYVAKPVPDYLIEKYQIIQNDNISTSTETTLSEKAPDIIVILGLDHAFKFKLPEIIETATSTNEVIDLNEIIEEIVEE